MEAALDAVHEGHPAAAWRLEVGRRAHDRVARPPRVQAGELGLHTVELVHEVVVVAALRARAVALVEVHLGEGHVQHGEHDADVAGLQARQVHPPRAAEAAEVQQPGGELQDERAHLVEPAAAAGDADHLLEGDVLLARQQVHRVVAVQVGQHGVPGRPNTPAVTTSRRAPPSAGSGRPPAARRSR